MKRKIMRFMALLFGSLLVLQLAAAAVPPSLPSPAHGVAEAKGRAAKPPGQRKSPEAEPLTYEREMEIENRRHVKNLRDIRYHYRFHKNMRKLMERKEYAFHAKRVEEIKKKYGMI